MRFLQLVLSLWILAAGAGCVPEPRKGAAAPVPPEGLAWLNEALIVLYADKPSDEVREAVARDFDADFLDWYCGTGMNRGNYFRARGVRNSGPEEYEYQEALQFSKADTEALFGDKGIAVTLEGRRAHFPPHQYNGAYFMCHNAPKWHETVKQGILRLIPYGQTLTQDNIGCPLNKGAGNFCAWCARGFRQYMRERYGPLAFQRFGVRSGANFDPRAYLLERRRVLGAEGLLEDALAREYIRYQYVSQLRAWEGICEDSRQEAAAAGRPLPALYGNQYGAWGELPFATALSSRVDVVWIECGCFGRYWNKPTEAWGPLVSKVGQAAGGSARPVWLWPMDYAEAGKDNRYSNSRIRIVLAESFANGGVVVQRVGRPGSACYDIHKEFSAFLAQNRALFTQRERLAEVGLVYSFPTWMWRRFSSLSVRFPAQQSFPAMARIMEESHLPYEVVLFGHKDVWEDSHAPSLGKYRAVVLPGVDCLSDEHAQALREYVAGGGALVICGDFAERDEEYRTRWRRVFSGVKLTKSGVFPAGLGKIIVITQQDMDAFMAKETREAGLQKIRSALNDACGTTDETAGPSRIIRTNAPNNVWINAWTQEQGRRLAVHLVNYNADLDKDTITPANNVEVAIKPDDATAFDKAVVLAPDAAPQDVPLAREGEMLKAVVPQVRSYAIVVFTSGDEMKSANHQARARRLRDRIAVVNGLRFRDAIAASPLELAQPDSAGPETILRLERHLRNLTQEYEATQRHTRSSLIERARTAVAAFDFGNEKAPPGWKSVTKDTKYDGTLGYGWENTAGIALRDAGKPDDPAGDAFPIEDALAGRLTRAFHVDTAPGEYVVTVITTAETHPRAVTQVEAEGATRLLGVLPHGGLVSARSFPVTVNDGQLNLRFVGYDTRQVFGVDGPVGPTTWVVNGLLIERAGETLTPVRAEAARHNDLAQGSLRDWLVIGPFDDDACEGMTAAYPPEKRIDLKARYPGKQPCAWRRYRTGGESGFAIVPFNLIYGDLDETVAYATTQVHVPENSPALLSFSSTGRATVWLNGRIVLTDRAATGLVTNEYATPVKLMKGWNRILVKVCNTWPGQWAFHAGLLNAASRPMDELRVSADGETGQAAKLQSVGALAALVIECAEDKIEVGGRVEVTVAFENVSDRPIGGTLSVEAEPNGVVEIEPKAPATFAGLEPGKKTTQLFAARLARCPAENAPILLNATLRSDERERRGTLRLLPVTPLLRISAGPGFVHEPFERAAAPALEIRHWRPNSPNVTALSADAQFARDGKPTLKAELAYDGDGKEAYGRIRAEFAEAMDWSSYNALRCWVRCADSNPAIKTRDICIAISGHDSGWQALARHSVPVNQWTLIEDDLTRYPRRAITAITPHLYEQYLSQQGTYTWRLGEMRLTRESRAHPELDAMEKGPLLPCEGLLRVSIYNALSREIEGRLSLVLPDGWRADPAKPMPVRLAAKKLFERIIRVTMPPSDLGRTHTVRAALTTDAAGSQETAVEVRPPRRLTARPASAPPKLDGLLDDACWQTAEAACDFAQNVSGQPAKAASRAYVTHDGKDLYVAYRCDEPQMKALATEVKHHDGQVWTDDSVEIYLQPNRNNAQDFYHIVANTAGTIRDERGASAEWDSGAQARAALGKESWTIEICIPFAALGGAPKPGDTWGINLCRSRQTKPGLEREYSCWSCTYGPFGNPERFGQMVFQQ